MVRMSERGMGGSDLAGMCPSKDRVAATDRLCQNANPKVAGAVAFTVRGRAVPQGALVRSPSGGLYHRDAKRLDAWRDAIADEARDAIGDGPCLEGPVAVHVDFVLPRPKHHYLPANRHRAVPELRLDAPAFVADRPDLDKLSRSLLDALTAVVIRDDGQVAQLSARKLWETDTLRPGCVVVVDGITLRWHPKALEAPAGCRPVWVSEGLFEALGGGRVEWGDPGPDGFYTPVIHQAWLSADELAKIIDDYLVEESPGIWSQTTTKIAHGLALTIVAALRGPAVAIPRGIAER